MKIQPIPITSSNSAILDKTAPLLKLLDISFTSFDVPSISSFYDKGRVMRKPVLGFHTSPT